MNNWRIENDIFDGYPHVFYKVLGLSPAISSVALSQQFNYFSIGDALEIIFDLRHIEAGDKLHVEIINSQSNNVFDNEITLSQSGIFTDSLAVPVGVIQRLAVGQYVIRLHVERADGIQSNSFEVDYVVYELFDIEISSFIPAKIQKPIRTLGTTTVPGNDELLVDYEVLGDGLESITSTIRVADFSATETFTTQELLSIDAVNLTTNQWNISFAFSVIDPNFRLISFRYFLEPATTTTSPNVIFNVNSVTQANIPFPSGGGWAECVLNQPMHLPIGSHTLNVTNSSGSFRLFSTAVRPTVPGLTITSTTIHRMEITYMLSTGGISREHTIKIPLNNDIPYGSYPLIVEGEARLVGDITHKFIRETDNIITILPPEEIIVGAVSLNRSGRYIGAEIPITATITGLEHIQTGDILNVILKSDAQILSTFSTVLNSGDKEFEHTFLANNFVGLSAGEYTVVAEVVRGLSSIEVIASYTVIPAPTVRFTSIWPNTILLPFSNRNPITLETNWEITSTGVNAMDSMIILSGTFFAGVLEGVEIIGDTSATVQIPRVSGLVSGTYSFSHTFVITSEKFGSVSVMGIAHNILNILPEDKAVDENVSFNTLFEDIKDLDARPYSIMVRGLSVVSSSLGTVPINIIYDDVIVASDVPIASAVFENVSSSVAGRFVGNEVDNTISIAITGAEYVEEDDFIRVDVADENAIHFTQDIALNSWLTNYSIVIPANAFIGLPTGEHTVTASIMRGNRVFDTRHIMYRVVPMPRIELTGVSQTIIQLPIFTPINLISSYRVVDSETTINSLASSKTATRIATMASSPKITSISGEVLFNNELATNDSIDPEGAITVASMNVHTIEPGQYTLDTNFIINSRFGQVTISETFTNAVTVFPQIMTTGIETKYTSWTPFVYFTYNIYQNAM